MTESNLERHRRHRAEIIRRAETGYDYSDRQANRWLHLVGERFAEHGWPLEEVPQLAPIERWMTNEEATRLLIERVPWCAERKAECGGRLRDRDWSEWFSIVYSRCPAELIMEHFDLSTTIQLQLMSIVCSDVGDLLDFTTLPNRLNIIEKIRRSFWHASCYDGRQGTGVLFYNHLARILTGIQRFTFNAKDQPGEFTAFIDTAYTMRWGGGVVNASHYSDAHLSFNVCRKGEHVFSIGFSPTEYGLAICQVQLKKPTGNRWLFSLGEHFLDYALERMHEAFPGEPLLLVSGSSAAEFVASNHTADKRPGYEVLRRIDELYSRPLKAWDRRAAPIEMGYLGGRSFHELVRLPEKE